MTGLITMPRLGETMEHGTVRAWLVSPGQPFRRGDIIAEIETDKTTVELPALEAGTIAELLANEGEVVDVGKPLARLTADPLGDSLRRAPSPDPALSGEGARRDSGASPVRYQANSETADTPPPEKERRLREAESAGVPPPLALSRTPQSVDAYSRHDVARPRASPAARRAARALGISLEDVSGTGPNGRRQGWDVRAFAERVTLGARRDSPLHFAECGAGRGLPVVFLHGFGGSVDDWTNIQNTIALDRRTIAIDLPGHGKSVDHPAADRGAMAAAVAGALDAADVGRAHLVGHSMGATVASAFALADPRRAASLTLIAPAGISPEINSDLLRRFARARDEAGIALLIAQFFNPATQLPRGLPARIADTRRDTDHRTALERILAAMTDGTTQPTFDLAGLAGTGIPVRVLWGTEDKVLPIAAADALPGVFALHRFPDVGHMPHLEAPRETIRLVKESIRGE